MSLIVACNIDALHRASRAEIRRIEKLHLSDDPLDDKWNLLLPEDRNRFGEALIPAPSLFQQLTSASVNGDLNNNNHGIATLGECAAHLELLEVFFTLRWRIVNSSALDVTFGVHEKTRIVYRKKYQRSKKQYMYKPYKLGDDTFKGRRREKWSYYLAIAAERFGIWVRAADRVVASQSTKDISLPFLPPLDILMVWHAFLLNPVDFKTYCQNKKLMAIRRLKFPWAQVHQAINSNDWTYILPPQSQEWFTDVVQMKLDLFEYLEQVGMTSNTVSDTLSRFGLPDNQVGSLWASLKSLVLDTHDKEFVNLLLQIQVGGGSKSSSSPLVDNVKRQAAFVDKMHSHLWICSPSAKGTLSRALDRYQKFLKLFQLYPGKMLVPTLDIDLVWHTHQCSAERYEEAMRERTGRYINHDDKVGQTELNGGMDDTQDLFRTRFGQEYSPCLCWDCQMMTTALERIDEGNSLAEIDFHLFTKQVKNYVEYYRFIQLARRKKRGE